MVEIKDPERKGSKLPVWCMEDSDLGENPARTDFQEHCHWLSANAWPMISFISDFCNVWEDPSICTLLRESK